MRRWFLPLCCAVLFVLWLPGLRYPVVSDTVHYANLGISLWEDGRYALDGRPYAAHLPMHALLSYPLVRALGINLGMHVLTLLGGMAVLCATYALFRRMIGEGAARLATVFILLHPNFLLMSMLGSADLTFTALALGSLLSFLKAAEDRRWYLACGAAMGLASLTRYNGLPLLPLLFFWGLAARSRDRRSAWFWGGMTLSGMIIGAWFLRNFLVFGDPVHSVYVGELAQESDGPFGQILSNIVYYGNPFHNVFLLFPFAIAGVVFHARRQKLLAMAMLALWILTAIWWVQAMRFAFPGYALLLGFAALGVRDIYRWLRPGFAVTIIAAVLAAGAHAGITCLYAYGRCNAFLDRRVTWIPKNLGLTPEGFEAWAQAKNWINENVPRGSTVAVPGANDALRRQEGVFRKDIDVVELDKQCPAYAITQHPAPGDTVLFTTEDQPATSVVLSECAP